MVEILQTSFVYGEVAPFFPTTVLRATTILRLFRSRPPAFLVFLLYCTVLYCPAVKYVSSADAAAFIISPLGSSGPLNERRKGASPPEITVPRLSWPGVRPNETFTPPTTSNLLPTIIITEAKTSSPPLALFGVENAYPHQQMDVAVLTGQ